MFLFLDTPAHLFGICNPCSFLTTMLVVEPQLEDESVTGAGVYEKEEDLASLALIFFSCYSSPLYTCGVEDC